MADRVVAFLWTNRPATPPERSVAFTIAVIALGAKLAKVDGTVARSEVSAFRRVFIIFVDITKPNQKRSLLAKSMS